MQTTADSTSFSTLPAQNVPKKPELDEIKSRLDAHTGSLAAIRDRLQRIRNRLFEAVPTSDKATVEAVTPSGLIPELNHCLVDQDKILNQVSSLLNEIEKAV